MQYQIQVDDQSFSIEEKQLGTFSEKIIEDAQFAIINPLKIDEEDWKDLSPHALKTSPAPARDHLLPQLISLSDLETITVSDLLDRDEKYRKRGVSFFCALLCSESSLDDILFHFKKIILQKRPNDHQRWWFRFYDPNVFKHLNWILTAKQLTRLMGPVTQWAWPDRKGNWFSVYRPMDAPLINWLELDVSQWNSIDNLQLINESLRRLSILSPEWNQNSGNLKLFGNLVGKLDSCYNLSNDDLQYIAESCVKYTENLIDHPYIKKMLENITESESSLASQFENIDNMTWKSILLESRIEYEKE